MISFRTFYLTEVEIFGELDAGDDELFDLGEDPDDHGREGKLLWEGSLLQAGVGVGKAIRDAFIFAWSSHLNEGETNVELL